MPPELLAERYQLGSRVGSGGMATVYEATDTVLGRRVAVKVLAEAFAAEAGSVERFRREARAAAGLNHPNVVAVYDHGSTNGSHFIVMEHVEGQTVGELLGQGGALPPEQAAAIGSSVATALEAAHQKGLVHRDVKPANILLTTDGRAKVTDFGIARATDGSPLTGTGMVLGTAAYLAPEQARGEPTDHRSDIYALGCVLYEMLTGRPPFQAENPVALASMHVHDEPVPPRSVRDDIPPALEGVVLTAMAKDPEARFQSATEMAGALRDAVDRPTQPIERRGTAVLPVVGPPGAAPPEPRSRWIPWAILAAVVAALGLFLAFRPQSAVEERQAARQPVAASPSPSPPPVSEDLSVGEAYNALLALLREGAAEGGISSKAADEIARKAGRAIATYEEGKLDEALARLGEASSKVEERFADGQITAEWGPPLTAAIDELEEAFLRDPPELVEEDEGDEEGGNSGKGKGKGEGKGKGSGHD